MPQSYFADEYRELREREHFRQPPDSEDKLVAKIINFVRRANITVSPPAHIKPPVWSNPVDLSTRVTVPLGVGAYATAIRLEVPKGRWARIETYGVQVDDNTYNYDGSILWRFRKNGVPVGDGMSDWAQQRGSIFNPRLTYLILKEEDVLEFQVRRAVVAPAAQEVEMAISGWTWRLRNNYEGTAGSVTAF